MNAPGVMDLREVMGRAHYDRMRQGMLPTWNMPLWTELTDGQREPYRQRVDYLVPALVGLMWEPAETVASLAELQ